MNMCVRRIYAHMVVILGVFGVCGFSPLLSFAKPTRTQIIKYLQTCKADGKKADLIAVFGSDYSDSDLRGIDFRGVHKHGFETNLRGANFARSQLKGAKFGASILEKASFVGAVLHEASFVTANLKFADFRKAQLKGAQLQECDLHSANFSKVNFAGVTIAAGDWRGADLRHTSWSKAHFTFSFLNLRNANLSHARMKGANLGAAAFHGANLVSADLSNANLYHAEFQGANLQHTSFKGANVKYAAFKGAKGLSSAQRQALIDKAQRWKYELSSGLQSFLKAAYFPAYLLTLFLLIWFSIRLLRKEQNRWWMKTFFGLNGLLFSSFLVSFSIMYFGGVSPTAQMNAGSANMMNLWAAWVALWIPFFFFALFSVAVSVLLGGAHFLWLRKRMVAGWRKTIHGYVGLTVIHSVFATLWILQLAPTA